MVVIGAEPLGPCGHQYTGSLTLQGDTEVQLGELNIQYIDDLINARIQQNKLKGVVLLHT